MSICSAFIHSRISATMVSQVVLRPVHAEAEVAAGQRSFDHHVVGQAVGARAFLEEQLQRAQRGDDDAQLDVAKARMVLDQRERTQVQAGRQGDAVDPRVQCRLETDAQGLPGVVHGQLFHAVGEDHALAALGFHGAADMQGGGFRQQAEVELDHGLLAIGDVELVLPQLVLDVLGVEAAVGNRRHHRVGDVADAAQARHFQRQLRGRNIHAHAADHDRHQFLFAQTQAEIIDALHCRLIRDLDSVTLSPVGARFCLHGAGKFFDPGP
jgi:hypothetical protein